MQDRFLALRLFVRVAQLGSFSKAGKEFGLSQPSASRIIAALEEDVGTALMTRTTRATTLTDAGADYLARIESIVIALEEAAHAARGSGELRGVLRVGLSSSFTNRVVIPCLPEFMRRHPQLRIDLLMDDNRQNLVGEGIDVAIRFGALIDSTATARRIGVVPRLLLAAPTYLKAEGIPITPADLPSHRIVMNLAGRAQGAWLFEKDGRTLSIRVDSKLHINNNEAAVAAAVAGLGIVVSGKWGARAEIESGALIRLLPDWSMDSVEVNAVFAAGRATKPAARLFANYLADRIDAVEAKFHGNIS